jgi:hypothetical protein
MVSTGCGAGAVGEFEEALGASLAESAVEAVGTVGRAWLAGGVMHVGVRRAGLGAELGGAVHYEERVAAQAGVKVQTGLAGEMASLAYPVQLIHKRAIRTYIHTRSLIPIPIQAFLEQLAPALRLLPCNPPKLPQTLTTILPHRTPLTPRHTIRINPINSAHGIHHKHRSDLLHDDIVEHVIRGGGL